MAPTTRSKSSGSSQATSTTGNWVAVNRGLDELIALKDPSHVSYLAHAALYSAVFNYTIATRLDPNDIDTPGMGDLKLRGNQRSPNAKLYCALSNKLDTHLKSIFHNSSLPMQDASGLQREALLEFYSLQWSRYRVLVSMLERVCTQVTQTWVKKTMATRHDIYTVEALALSRWKVILVDGLQGDDRKLTGALLDLIDCRRTRQPVNLNLLKFVLDSLVTLGRSGEHGEVATPDVYRDVFENAFFDETTKLYRQASAGLICGNVRSYVQEAGNWLTIEGGFASFLPIEESHANLRGILNDVLVLQHAPRIEAYMSDCIRDARRRNLRELYFFCARLPGAIDCLREIFVQHFKAAALSAGRIDGSRVTSLKKAYSDVVVESFEKDLVIIEELDQFARAIIDRS